MDKLIEGCYGRMDHPSITSLNQFIHPLYPVIHPSVYSFIHPFMPLPQAITDETLSFVGRSRRLLVVLSPGFASRGTQALLELKAGLDHMALGGHLRVILVQYRPLKGQALVGELRRARVVLALLHWKGDKSKELTSRFWKRLRLELPLQKGRDAELNTARTYQSQTSTSSQTGLLKPGGQAVHRAQYS